MNLKEIKKVIKENPETLLVMSDYAGASATNSHIVQVVSTTRVIWKYDYGWIHHPIQKNQIDLINKDTTAPGYVEPQGRNYVLLVREPAETGLNTTKKDIYYLTKPDDLRGLYAVVEQQWKKETELYKILSDLKAKRQTIINEQHTLAVTQTAELQRQIKEFLTKYGNPEKDYDNDYFTDVSVKFQRKDYPELEHLAGSFTDDLDNFTTHTQVKARNFDLDQLLDFLEMVYQLEQDKKELTTELEKERKKNAATN